MQTRSTKKRAMSGGVVDESPVSRAEFESLKLRMDADRQEIDRLRENLANRPTPACCEMLRAAKGTEGACVKCGKFPCDRCIRIDNPDPTNVAVVGDFIKPELPVHPRNRIWCAACVEIMERDFRESRRNMGW